MEDKRFVEINGIKMEVDLRTAKRIDTFRVGDAVKVLDMNYSDSRIRAGVIVGFAEFQKAPAIEVMVLEENYNGIGFKFITISNSDDAKYEVIHYNNYESLFTQSSIVTQFDRNIEKKRLELAEEERKKEYFINDFEKAFSSIVPAVD